MTVDTKRQKCVVLAGQNLSPRQLSVELIQRGITPVSCYDGGVEMFIHGKPDYREGGAGDGGEAELTEWLGAEGGVLVTSELQFRGAEADTVIFVTKCWAGCGGFKRSPVTRAVAGLTLVAGACGGATTLSEMRKHWEVIVCERSNAVNDSDEAESDIDE